MDKIFEITAKEVTIQVKDERTGSGIQPDASNRLL